MVSSLLRVQTGGAHLLHLSADQLERVSVALELRLPRAQLVLLLAQLPFHLLLALLQLLRADGMTNFNQIPVLQLQREIAAGKCCTHLGLGLG